MLPVAFQNGGPCQTRTEEDIPEMKVSDLTTAADLETVRPELFRQLQERFVAEGRAAEGHRIHALVKACGGNSRLLVEALADEKAAAELLQSHAGELSIQANRLQRENEQLRQNIEDRHTATMTDEQLQQKFAASGELQDQFSSAEAYVAHLRHPAKK